MVLIDKGMADFMGVILGFVLTLMVLSYFFGDNPLFRFAMYLFVGVSAGYVVIITVYNILLPHLVYPLFNGGANVLTYLLWLGAILLFLKAIPSLSRVGNVIVAFLVGVGVAAAVGGAILGTIFPQTGTAMKLWDTTAIPDMINGIVIFIGTISTLAYFQFGRRQAEADEHEQTNTFQIILRWLGEAFIAVTFAALFVGVYVSALTALIERLSFVRDFIFNYLLSFIG